MNWLSNIFSTSSSANESARRKLALSTHDAFSLPTSSPLTSSHFNSFSRASPDAYDVDTLSPSTSSYSYPPPASPTTYDYIPRQNGKYNSTQSRQGSLLPLHSAVPLAPLPPYPSLEQTWARLRNWLTREYPELGDTLNWGILPQDLGDIELALGMPLPQPVRESYLIVDGQEAESSAGCSEGLFFGLTFLPLEDVLDEWRFWREVDNDPATGRNDRLKGAMKSLPPDWVRREYSSRGWIPLVTDKAGNYLGVDLDPGEKGVAGQVIVFGRDFDTKVVMWRGEGAAGWANWLAAFVEDLESGEGYEIGAQSDGSEDSEDDVGYEGYFFDGSGRTKGEGDEDSGGGLKLSGEYRGWSVLEAWADKSVKRWKDTGVISDKASPTVDTKDIAKHRMSVLDIASPVINDSAEVPIPVMNGSNGIDSSDVSTPTAASMKMANSSSSSTTQTPLPTISVTPVSKPPAPRPVDLPSPGDFQSPSPDASFDVDLEQGSKLSLDDSFEEVDHPLAGSSVCVKPPSSITTTGTQTHSASDSSSSVKEGMLVQLPTEEETLEETTQDLLHESEPSSVPIAPMDPVSTSVNEEKPEEDLLIPSSSATSEEVSTSETLVDEDIATPSAERLDPVEKSAVKESLEANDFTPSSNDVEKPEEGEGQDPDTTIRLIGGGGASGVVPSEPEPEANDPSDTASLRSVSSVASDSTTASKKGGAKKKQKSISMGLKRISQLGGRKRTDSKGEVPAMPEP